MMRMKPFPSVRDPWTKFDRLNNSDPKLKDERDRHRLYPLDRRCTFEKDEENRWKNWFLRYFCYHPVYWVRAASKIFAVSSLVVSMGIPSRCKVWAHANVFERAFFSRVCSTSAKKQTRRKGVRRKMSEPLSFLDFQMNPKIKVRNRKEKISTWIVDQIQFDSFISD